MKKHDTSYDKTRSGGPKTPEGKKRSAANSRTHGILSESIAVLQSESEADWEELLNGYVEEMKPVGFLEARLVQQMAWAEWRQIRAIRVESAAIDRQMDLDDREKWRTDCPTVDDHTRTSYAVQKLVDDSATLQHLSRYETRFNRMYHRALTQLLDLQEKRRHDGAGVSPCVPAPQPAAPEAPSAEREKINLPNEQPSAAAQQNYTPRNLVTQELPGSPPLLVLAAA